MEKINFLSRTVCIFCIDCLTNYIVINIVVDNYICQKQEEERHRKEQKQRREEEREKQENEQRHKELRKMVENGNIR